MTAATEQRRALILDRDGVINHDDGYVHRVAQCRFVDGIFAMTAAFARRGFAIVIATNQSGIGRGLYGEAEFASFMGWMRGEFARHGVPIAAVYHCPDHPTAGIGGYRCDNPWRKPGPGMMRQAAADLGLDPQRSWLVGDKAIDIAAGRGAGIGTLILFDATAGAVECRDHVWRVPLLADVAVLLEREERKV
ncbi:MAG TPA: HAD family hydrolase [Stellaceae bacterium]|nr:HAD family hydrolase [Stellaceae bacterium]